MAKQRVQVGELPGPQPVQTVAAPTDPFVPPAMLRDTSGSSALRNLAAGLSALSPGVDRLFQQEAEDEILEGEREALKLGEEAIKNRQSFQQLVKNGALERTSNPWFAKGLREQSFRILASEADAALKDAYAKSEVNDQDSDSVVRFATGFYSQFMSEAGLDRNSPSFHRSFIPQMQASINGLVASHQNMRQQRMLVEARENSATETRTILDTAFAVGADFDAEGFGAASAGKMLTELSRELVENTLVSGTEANAIILDQIITKALQEAQEGDPSVALEILDTAQSVDTGKGKLSHTATAREALFKARQSILQVQASKEKQAKADEATARKELFERYDAVGSSLLMDGKDEEFNQLMAQARTDALDGKLPGDALAKLQERQDGWYSNEIQIANSAVVRRDPTRQQYIQVLSEVLKGNVSYEDLDSLRRMGTLTPIEYKDLYAKKRSVSETNLSEFDSAFNATVGRISRIVGADIASSFNATGEVTATEIQNMAYELYFKWREGPGKDASLEDFRKWREGLSGLLVDTFVEDKEVRNPGQVLQDKQIEDASNRLKIGEAQRRQDQARQDILDRTQRSIELLEQTPLKLSTASPENQTRILENVAVGLNTLRDAAQATGDAETTVYVQSINSFTSQLASNELTDGNLAVILPSNSPLASDLQAAGLAIRSRGERRSSAFSGAAIGRPEQIIITDPQRALALLIHKAGERIQERVTADGEREDSSSGTQP